MQYIFLILMFFSSMCYAKQIRVAVIDTGFDMTYSLDTKLCETGHKSFVPKQTIQDIYGHGTNIVGLITKYAERSNYCLIIIKYYDKNIKNNHVRFLKALEHAYNLNVDMINISAGGPGIFIPEYNLIKQILDSKIIINAAAGNESLNLDDECIYYPACYDERIFVISSKNTIKANKGEIVDKYENGKNQTGFGITLSGTSQATAIFTGKAIKYLHRKINK